MFNEDSYKTKTVLIYLEHSGSFLMLYRNKKKNDLNKGKWIGIGGHIEDSETKEEALIREVKEETNLDLLSYKYRGIIYFENEIEKEIMYLYTSSDYSGEIKECNEGELKYVGFAEIFNLNLWEGDKIFLKYLLDDKEFFKLRLVYDHDKLVKVEEIK